MDSFTVLNGLTTAINKPNVDTDAIIPKQFIKSIKRTGFGHFLFDEWRFLDIATADSDSTSRRINPEFILNEPRYEGASILLGRENFGCGSSREHAVWALKEYGFRVIIAPSFADIFFGNCFKNGVLPIVLPANDIDCLFESVLATPGYTLYVDLPSQTVKTPEGKSFPFDITLSTKQSLISGLDDISMTLAKEDKITEFEKKHAANQPWLFT